MNHSSRRFRFASWLFAPCALTTVAHVTGCITEGNGVKYTLDAGGPARGRDGGEQPDTGAKGADAGTDGAAPAGFVDEFVDETRVDKATSTATVDPTGGGAARAAPAATLLGAGDAAEGDVALTSASTLAAGVHNMKSLSLGGGGKLTVVGATTLLVQGSFSVTGKTILEVKGDLTLVVGGAFTIDCANVIADGNVLVQHLDATTPMTLGCKAAGVQGEGTISSVNRSDATKSGSVEVDSVGPMVLSGKGYIFSGRNTAGPSGDVAVRAYGDITLDGDGYINSGDAETAPEQVGRLTVTTEGSLTLDHDSYFISGRGQKGTGMVVNIGKGVALHNGSYFIVAAGSAPMDVVAGGDLVLDTDSYLLTSVGDTTASSISVVAKSLKLTNAHISSARGGTTGRGGSVTVKVDGPATLEASSTIFAGGGPCVPGSDATLLAKGPITVASTSSLIAGASFDGTGCTKVAGGNVLVTSGAAVSLDATASVVVGAGTTAGALQKTENASVTVAVAPKLTTPGLLQSTALPLGVTTASLVKATISPANARATLFLSPDGSDGAFARADGLVGTELREGWKYRLVFDSRMFEGAFVDRLEVTYR